MNLSVNLKRNGANQVDNVSGVAQPGRLLAMMGPSGAGNIFLTHLAISPYANVIGQVTFGKWRFTSEDLFFVPQFDEVNSNFTVYEQIEIVGLLRCKDKKAMYAHLDKLIQTLGLQKIQVQQFDWWRAEEG